MHEINEVRLTGFITKVYPQVMTPAERKVSRFVLEHQSEQYEINKLRWVKCKIFCVSLAYEITEKMLNCRVSASGFLSLNSHKELVLHITNIQNLD